MRARLNLLDRAIGFLAPRAALKRGIVRGRLDAIRSYDGAGMGRRTQGWKTTRTSADAENNRAILTLRNRSRDLTRNNPHAKKALTVWVNNLVGAGIVPRAKSGNDVLDKAANKLFMEWSESCDADGQLDFFGIQELLVREMVEGGEVLVRRRNRRPEDNLPVPLQLQVMEADQLDEFRIYYLGANVGQIINGVQLDPIGRRTAYWLFPVHPGNSAMFPTPGIISAPVPASEIVHLYRKDRTQVRGVPWCSAIISRARDIDDYEDAEITRKKLEACVVAFVEGPDAIEGIAPAPGEGSPVTDANGNPIEQFEPGLIARIADGRKIVFNNPTQGGGYSETQKIGLHAVAAGYLIPYELLTGDLAEVSFTSGRMGRDDFRRLCGTIQRLCIIPMALQPIWDWVMEMGYLIGKLPQKIIPCEWETPAFESVNPIDDANAELISIRAGTQSLISAIAKRTGRDPTVVLEEISETNALLDRLGLIFDSDPRKVARTGVEQPTASPAPQPPPSGRPPLRSVS